MGFEYDLLDRFSKYLDVRLNLIVVTNIDSAINKLNSGEGDVLAYGFTVTNQRKKIVDFIADQGVMVHGAFMLGFPTETEEEMQATIDWAADSSFHTAAIPSSCVSIASSFVALPDMSPMNSACCVTAPPPRRSTLSLLSVLSVTSETTGESLFYPCIPASPMSQVAVASNVVSLYP